MSSPSSSRNAPLIAAAILSVLAQGLLLIPFRLDSFLPYFPPWADVAAGATLFALSTFAFLRTTRGGEARISRSPRVVEILLGVQTLAVVGLLSLLQSADGFTRAIGFLAGTGITLLGTAGLLKAQADVEGKIRAARANVDVPLPIMSEPDSNLGALREQVSSLQKQLLAEKRRAIQLTFLNELSQQLETELDPPVAAQLAVNTLERAIENSSVALLMQNSGGSGYSILAAAGRAVHSLPTLRSENTGESLVARTARLKKTQMSNNGGAAESAPGGAGPVGSVGSVVSVPVVQQGHVRGVLIVSSDKPNALNALDAAIIEGIAAELMRAWERSSYHQRLRELIQAGISLTTLLDPQAAVLEIAMIARKTLQAEFVFVSLLDQQGNFSRTASAGEAPKLLGSLQMNTSDEPLIQAALNAAKPIRVRDLRRYLHGRRLNVDRPSLRSVLAMPIRLHRLSIGAIVAFGKQDEIFFAENDESLADLLSSQAAASIESSWLYQELRNTLNTTSMLYQLSVDVIQTEDLSQAAELIAHASHKMTNARDTGIVLMNGDGQVRAEVEIDASGLHTRREHPTETIDQAILTGQSIIVSIENGSLVCYPLLTRGRTYGALWMKIPESRGQNFANLQTLANQAAIALERSILLQESRRQAKQLEAAYAELEITYDRTLTALMSALDARDRETEGHSMRVSRLACQLGEKIGLSGAQLKALERGALLHDIGKIGISDTILHKSGRLTPEEWKIMRVHPDIGARIVEGIPFLQETLPVIRYHHERWDGSGYPAGLAAREIPTQARIFAVADVFDALTSSRRYRKKSSPDEALEYLREHADILFDPQIVEALAELPYREFGEGEKTIA